MSVTITDFYNAVEEERCLIVHGFSAAKSTNFDEERANFKASATAFEEFGICCEFLNQCPKIKTPTIPSFLLKKTIEHKAGRFISNGALIASVIHLQIPYKAIPNCPYVKIALSKKAVQD